jgi:hypothetical protein
MHAAPFGRRGYDSDDEDEPHERFYLEERLGS